MFRTFALALAVVCGIALGCPAAEEPAPSVAPDSPPAEAEADAGDAPVPRPPAVDPPAPGEIDTAIQRGIDFLLQAQLPNGAWGSAHRTKDLNIFAPVPGAHHAFRAAVTSLCISALIETGGDRPEVQRAIERAEAWMFENLPKVRRADAEALYNSWAHAYALDALVHMLGRKPGDAERLDKIRKLAEQQLDLLRRYECVDGGWCYYDFEAHTQKPSGSSLCFVSATVLVAMRDVREAGIPVEQRLVDRAMASLRRQRKPDFSYFYGEYLKYRPMRDINRPGGSLGRSQACNLAMRYWGDETVTEQVLIDWLDRIFARNLWLDMARKRPMPHESWFAVAAYFFYYGHYYAARCIEELPPEKRPFYHNHLARILLRLQEKDGSWWDFPFYDYHQPYGTAFALMALARCHD